jgi:hypothetical protein
LSTDILTTKVEVTRKDCIELMTHLPPYKIAFAFLALFFPVLCIIVFFLNLDDFSATAQSATEWIIIMGATAIIIEIMVFIGYKLTPKFGGRNLYKKLKKNGVNELIISFDKKTKKFLVGPKSIEMIPNSKLQIVSAKRNYLFYFGKGLLSRRFYLPKKTEASQDGMGEEVVKFLSREEKSGKNWGTTEDNIDKKKDN